MSSYQRKPRIARMSKLEVETLFELVQLGWKEVKSWDDYTQNVAKWGLRKWAAAENAQWKLHDYMLLILRHHHTATLKRRAKKAAGRARRPARRPAA